MNKTVTASLASLVFHIDEKAYIRLQAYIEDVKARLGNDEDSGEIILDIESRIAELFIEKTEGRKEVVSMEDVESVIDTMGSPDDYGDSTEHSSDEPHIETESTGKKIYRDPDNTVFGGVCSGIGAFFNWDPSWVRLAFILLFFVMGTGVLLYLALWLVLPVANTTAEKLEMRGKTVNAQSIKDHLKNFQKEVENIGSKKNTQKLKTLGEQMFQAFGRIFGLFCLMMGAILLVILVYWVFTKDFIISVSNNGLNGFNMSDLMEVSLTPFQNVAILIGTIFLFAGPIIGLFTLAVRLFFNIQKKIKAAVIVSTSFWVLGMVILSVAAIGIGRDRSSNYIAKESIEIPKHVQTLKLDISEDIHFNNAYNNVDDYFFELLKKDGDQVHVGWPKLDIVPSESQNFELIVHKSSLGRTQREAIDNSNAIIYPIKIEGNQLIVPPYFTFDLENKYKMQDVNVILKVPDGRSVELSKRMSRVLHKVDNEFSIPEHKLAGKTWTMKENVLVVGENMVQID